MSERAKTMWATWLLVGAVLVGIAGIVMWGNASDAAEHESSVNGLTNAILIDDGNPRLATLDEEVEPNRTPATVAFVVAGGAVLAGVILIAGARPEHSTF